MDEDKMNKLKVLYLYNSAVKNKPAKGVNSFNLAAYRALKELGFEYHGNTFSEEAAGYYEDDNVYLHVVEIYRNPFSKEVFRAYKQLMKLLKEIKFDIIHCNTPIGGFLGRICGHKAGVRRIIYQAHGFHFYKGAPFLNWLLYYPIERWLAHYTDALITINSEDYELAKRKFKLRNNGKIYYVPGVGIDLSQFNREPSPALRASLGISPNDVMIISAGDLVERKNYQLAIKAVAAANIHTIKYCICGQGPEEEKLKRLAKNLEVEDQVLFLGFRTDMKQLFHEADIFLFTTKQEGLPRSMMEAMASGLPCIASNVRGNTDLLEDKKGGFICDVDSIDQFTKAIKTLAADPKKRKEFADANVSHIAEFDISKISDLMKNIYHNEVHALDRQLDMGGGVN